MYERYNTPAYQSRIDEIIRVAMLICANEKETGDVVPRRGNIHDIGRTLTHKRINCRKAYLEGKTTPIIARQTCH